MHRRLAFASLVLVLALGACSDDDPDEGADAQPSSTSSTTEAAESGDDMPTCDELFGEGVTLREDAFDIACTTDRDPEGIYYGAQFEDCEDGRRLYSSEVGWGYVGEPWHTDADEPPATELAACTGG